MFFLHDVWLLFIGGSFKKSEFVVTKSINHWSVVVLLREGETRKTSKNSFGKVAITIKYIRSLYRRVSRKRKKNRRKNINKD